MKLTWLWLLPVLHVHAAPGNAAVYERLYYWYAYELDAGNSQIAPGCAQAQGRRCNFVEFQNWIKGAATVDPSKLANIDPDNIFEAAQQLDDGGYKGDNYDTSRVHQDVSTTADINKAREEVDFFMHNNVQRANSFRLANIESIVTYILDVRTGNLANAVREYLRRDIPDLVTKLDPILDGRSSVEAVNTLETARRNDIYPSEVRNRIRTIEKVEAPYNIRAYIARARIGAKVVTGACARVE